MAQSLFDDSASFYKAVAAIIQAYRSVRVASIDAAVE
jgi:hypothetical protein